MSAHLRQAVATDIPGMWVVRYAVTENTLTPGRLGDEDVRREIEDTGRGWVIERAGEIKAFAIGNRCNSNVWALFVLPEEQGRGHGHRLHQTMVEWLFAEGAGPLWLNTAADSRACRFYEARGWKRLSVAENGEARYELHR